MSASTSRRRVLGLAAGVAALALTVTACAGGGEDPSAASGSGTGTAVTFGLTYIPNVQFSPVYAAADDGLYAAAGLDLTIRHHGSDEGLFTALTSGEEDVVLATGDEVLQARDQGLDVVSIAPYYRDSPVEVIVRDDSGIATMADLKGRFIGVPGEYGSSWLALLAFLDEAGLSRDDVTVTSIGYTQVAALTSGQVDAVVGFSNNELLQLQAAGVPVHTVDGGDAPLVPASIVTTRAWLEAHPAEAKAVVTATMAGVAEIAEEPAQAVEVTSSRDTSLSQSTEAQAMASAVAAATIDLMLDDEGRAPTGAQDVEAWRAMAEFMRGVPGLLTNDPDVDAAVVDLVSAQG